jgi:hypothetical protein
LGRNKANSRTKAITNEVSREREKYPFQKEDGELGIVLLFSSPNLDPYQIFIKVFT